MMALRRVLPIVACVLAVLFSQVTAAQDTSRGDAMPATLVIAPDGDDANAGTMDEPMATLRAALGRMAAMAEGERQARTIIVRGGIYELRQAIRLTSVHSGLTITAAPGEQPIFSGGRRVRDWRLVDKGLWSADMPAELAEARRPSALYMDGRRLPPARFPNEGYLRVKQVTREGNVLMFDDALPAEADRPGEIVVLRNWSASIVPADEIGVDRVTTGGRGTPTGDNGLRPGRRAYLQFARSAFDAPYEWLADAPTRQILLRLPEGVDPNQREIIAPVLPQLLSIAGGASQPVRQVKLHGLRFMYAHWLPPTEGYHGRQATHYSNVDPRAIFTVPAAVWLSHVEDSTLQRLSVQHMAGGGIALGRATRRVTIDQCVIDGIGGNGVMIGWRTEDGEKRVGALDGDWGDEGDVPTGNALTGSLIQRCGEQLPGAVGVWVAFAADTRIAGNLIRDLPYTGISLGFKWNSQRTSMRGSIVEANRITNVMRLLADGGGIYTLGSQPDTHIRRNVIHGVHRHDGAEGSPNNGMFIDEGTQHLTISDNVIYHTSGSAVRLHQAKRDEQTWGENHIGQGSTEPADAPRDVLDAAGPPQTLLDQAAIMLSREPWPILLPVPEATAGDASNGEPAASP